MKANFWLIAMACGCFQVLQAMSNGSAVRSGVGAIWVGAMSATISALIARSGCCRDLPPSASRHEPDHGARHESRLRRHVGAFIVTGLAFVAPRLGPTQTFLLYFFVIAVTSTLIDGFGLLGTDARPLEARQLVGVLLAGVGLVLARPEASDSRPGAPVPTQGAADSLSLESTLCLTMRHTLYLTLLISEVYYR